MDLTKFRWWPAKTLRIREPLTITSRIITMVKRLLILLPAALCLCVTSVFAQEAAKDQPLKIMLSEEGKVSGVVVLDEKNNAPQAKVTLSADGKVVDSVTADENGNFSFANVEPGAYSMLAASGSMFGAQPIAVEPFVAPAASAAPVQIGLEMAPSSMVYDSFASAPISSFSSCDTCSAAPAVSTCGSTPISYGSSCGCGAGGGLGGRLGGGLLGRGGGGLLSRPGIGLIGLAGLAGLGGDDESPDR